jgi:hypothetical protein
LLLAAISALNFLPEIDPIVKNSTCRWVQQLTIAVVATYDLSANKNGHYKPRNQHVGQLRHVDINRRELSSSSALLPCGG